jgi:hypothetical protein
MCRLIGCGLSRAGARRSNSGGHRRASQFGQWCGSAHRCVSSIRAMPNRVAAQAPLLKYELLNGCSATNRATVGSGCLRQR